jgi:aldose sugar dehydrogenase
MWGTALKTIGGRVLLMLCRTPYFALLALGFDLAVCPAVAEVDHSEKMADELPSDALVQIAEGLEFAWSFAFLPDLSIIVTERAGRIKIIAPGQSAQTLNGVPTVLNSGHGGLLDIALDPGFEQNQILYISYVHGTELSSTVRVMRGKLNRETSRLRRTRGIFESTPSSKPELFGGRMVVTIDGYLFLTLGDRTERQGAQDLTRHQGSIIRIRTDGSVPDDNPFVSTPSAQPEIWSKGHRNPQGLVVDPKTGQLWSHEHGPKGGDELNHILPGRNYGWPVITHGVDYSGIPIGEGREKDGMEQPVHYWSPSIAPSGLAIQSGGDATKFWIGALVGQAVVSLDMNNGAVTERRLFEGIGRVRDVRIGPDNLLHILTDGPAGAIYRFFAPAVEQAHHRGEEHGLAR